jgi:hypothetical protein
MIYELRIYRCVPWLRRKLGQDRWLDAFTLLGKLGQVGVSPHSTPLAPRPAGLFLGSRVPRSTRQILAPLAEWPCSRQQPSL